MICKKCGQILGDGVQICPICKTVQDGADIHKQQKLNDKELLQRKIEQEVATDKMQADPTMQEDMRKVQNTSSSLIFEEEVKDEDKKERRTSQKSGYPYPPRSRVLAGLLQIFFGGFGIGRFYLGYNSMALGQLFTMPIFGLGAIWGFIDGILILCGQVPYDVNGIPLQ